MPPIETQQYTASALAREFGLDRATVVRRMTDVPHDMRGKSRVWTMKAAAPALLQVGTERLDANQEIAALNKARREQVEMRTAAERGELVEAEDIAAEIARMAAEVISILEGLPAQLRRRNTELTQSDIELVRREIARARNRVAALYEAEAET